MRLVDADILWEKACRLEAEALDYIGRIDISKDRDEWHRWQAILGERMAFKHDIFDASTIDPKIKDGYEYATWIKVDAGVDTYVVCSRCNHAWTSGTSFCPNCGAHMSDEEEEHCYIDEV